MNAALCNVQVVPGKENILPHQNSGPPMLALSKQLSFFFFFFFSVLFVHASGWDFVWTKVSKDKKEKKFTLLTTCSVMAGYRRLIQKNFWAPHCVTSNKPVNPSECLFISVYNENHFCLHVHGVLVRIKWKVSKPQVLWFVVCPVGFALSRKSGKQLLQNHTNKSPRKDFIESVLQERRAWSLVHRYCDTDLGVRWLSEFIS